MKRIGILSITLLALIPAFWIRAQEYYGPQTRKPEVWHREWGWKHVKIGELRNGKAWSIEFVEPLVGEDIHKTLTKIQPGDQLTGRAVSSDNKQKLSIIGVAVPQNADASQASAPERNAQYLGQIQNPDQPGSSLAIFGRESAMKTAQRWAEEAQRTGQQAYTSAQQFGQQAYTGAQQVGQVGQRAYTTAAAGLGSLAAPITSAFRAQPTSTTTQPRSPQVWHREWGWSHVKIGELRNGGVWSIEFAEPLLFGEDVHKTLAKIQPGDEVTGRAVSSDNKQKLSIIGVAVPQGVDARQTALPESGAQYFGQIPNPDQSGSSLAIFKRESTMEAARHWAGEAQRTGQQAYTGAQQVGQRIYTAATGRPNGGIAPTSQQPISPNAPVYPGPGPVIF
jgi:hypothetical protein